QIGVFFLAQRDGLDASLICLDRVVHTLEFLGAVLNIQVARFHRALEAAYVGFKFAGLTHALWVCRGTFGRFRFPVGGFLGLDLFHALAGYRQPRDAVLNVREGVLVVLPQDRYLVLPIGNLALRFDHFIALAIRRSLYL